MSKFDLTSGITYFKESKGVFYVFKSHYDKYIEENPWFKRYQLTNEEIEEIKAGKKVRCIIQTIDLESELIEAYAGCGKTYYLNTKAKWI